MSNCMICFSDFEQNKKYKCCNPECTEYLCFDCLKRYIEIAKDENSLPTCPREKCIGVFDEKTLPKEFIEMFHELLWNHFLLVKKGDISEARKTIVLRDILKEEKMKFMVESMPAAVKLVAKLAFMGRLRKIRKIQEGRNKDRISRTCINLVCNGFLDETFTCTKCKVLFCKECEDEKTEDHICNVDSVASVKCVNEMVSCPSCKTKIEHASGCMAMTCAVCNTNFWYTTGEKGDHGNHGQNVGVRLKENIKVSLEYKDKIPHEYIAIIRDLESVLVNSRSTKWKEQFETMLLRGLINHHKFSGLYSEIVRTDIVEISTTKKLVFLEKILVKCELGYKEQIKTLFQDKNKISVVRVISSDKKNRILDDDPTLFENMVSAMAEMKVSSIDVRKAIEHNSGVFNGFHWSFVE